MIYKSIFLVSALLQVLTIPSWAELPVESWGLAPHYEKWVGRLKQADPYAMMEVWKMEKGIGCKAARNKQVNFIVLAKPLMMAESEKKIPLALYYRSVIEQVENPNSDSYLPYLIQAAQLGEPLALSQLEMLYDRKNDIEKRNSYAYQTFIAYKKLAEGGDPSAMFTMAFFYLPFLPPGTITEEEKKNWLQKAFAAGSVGARKYIAEDKLASDKIDDQLAGIDICKKLADENNYWGAVILAQYYLEHNSPDKAVIWANKAKALVGCNTVDIRNILEPE